MFGREIRLASLWNHDPNYTARVFPTEFSLWCHNMAAHMIISKKKTFINKKIEMEY